MVTSPPLDRIVKGQSPNDTPKACKGYGIARRTGAFMVSMSLAIIIALIVAGGPVRANDGAAHVTAVAVAKAQIISGIRIDRDYLQADNERSSRNTRLPKPRERPCPEADTHPCRLIVVDMP